MLFILLIAILPISGLGFYAVRKISPAWVRMHASFARIFVFSLEAGRTEEARESPEQLSPVDDADD